MLEHQHKQQEHNETDEGLNQVGKNDQRVFVPPIRMVAHKLKEIAHHVSDWILSQASSCAYRRRGQDHHFRETFSRGQFFG